MIYPTTARIKRNTIELETFPVSRYIRVKAIEITATITAYLQFWQWLLPSMDWHSYRKVVSKYLPMSRQKRHSVQKRRSWNYWMIAHINKTWWRHQMETFSALLAICAGNSPVTGEFPTQRPVTRTFDVFFDMRLNEPLSKQSWGWWFETRSFSLWHHCNGILRQSYKEIHTSITLSDIAFWHCGPLQ